MNVFEFRDKLIADYSSYVRSFIRIRDERVKHLVDDELERGLLWPDPLIQLNPSFEHGKAIDELVAEGLLHQECKRIFRRNKESVLSSTGIPMRLHRHQEEAIRVAREGRSYVLTTGTGSGKSLAYIVPIVDFVLRNGSGRGVKAIVVYPMNALANSQEGELRKFLCHGYPDGKSPVTFRRYTGQENDEQRKEIIASPPDIILTNFVMLELMLTRPDERKLVESAKGLRFLVLDELHTYRGRQGSDVALLSRRVRELVGSPELQCVGTSATLAGPGTLEEQQKSVAQVASLILGMPVAPDGVIGETLRRATPVHDSADAAFLTELKKRLAPSRPAPETHEALVADPLASWIETTFGLATEPETGRLVRAQPRSVTGVGGAARELSQRTGVSEDLCGKAIEETLLAGYRCLTPDTGFPTFAFRLHQFLSRGDTVYASFEPEPARYITVQKQQFVPERRPKILLPLTFCRECGQEYYCARRHGGDNSETVSFEPRELSDTSRGDGSEAGFLYLSAANPWPADGSEVLERIPQSWLDEKGTGIQKDRRKYLPKAVRIGADGKASDDGTPASYISAPFRFCLLCGVSYSTRSRSDFGKLSSLATEGRSTATTVLTLSSIRQLATEKSLRPEARKLLSFTDNRQDASLQAGHFNDFIEVSLLRGALYQAIRKAGGDGLHHDEISAAVFNAIALPLSSFATNPEAKFQALEETNRALREVLAYRIYRDLRRGWRIVAPNLEQCGLLEIGYASLKELCADEDSWKGTHQALVEAKPDTRERIARTLLDHLRRELAIKVEYLDAEFQDRLRQRASQRLIAPWGIDEDEANEQMERASVAFPRPTRRGDAENDVFLSPRGGFGIFLRSKGGFSDLAKKLSTQDAEHVTRQLFDVLEKAGILAVVREPKEVGNAPGYQLLAGSMLWSVGDGTQPFHDPISMPSLPAGGAQTNRFFVDFYGSVALTLKGIEAREHTAQVPNEQRQRREEAFREGRLPILFCSPTMELGVDIAELNVVNMRNVPPTPANYAQRSGRAGRSGQPALVFSYCSTGSSHDQYFFRRPQLMVSGRVAPPRLDLINEDLIQAHLQAVWLAETGVSLGKTLRDVLDLSGEEPSLALLAGISDDFKKPEPRARARKRAERVLGTLRGQLDGSDWYSEAWLDEVFAGTALRFDAACERWRSLYRAAHKQAKDQSLIILDASRPAEDKKRAMLLRREAESQLELLTEVSNVVQSDFYSYRYFASEGFLPGYNFPRLPVSAFIPGRRQKQGQDDFLSRPRFLAISEFGPRALVYHEGSRYSINRVMLPVDQDDDPTTTTAKLCGACGYLHHYVKEPGPDLCNWCSVPLPPPLRMLFRMRNVSTRRRQKINSDEEERQRLGFELKTGFRFAERGGHVSVRKAAARSGSRELAELHYAPTATLWRINLGWTRRALKDQFGFVLDMERGYWATNEQLEDADEGDTMSPKTARVVPFVEDRRNCLTFRPSELEGPAALASLQAALKNAIQIEYQLEDSEIAAERLPDRDKPSIVLLYEAAEGGAGILKRLVDEPAALPAVARRALKLCHFNPDTGEDLKIPHEGGEPCEAACYFCLMSYGNQRDHGLLDRQTIRAALLALASSAVDSSPTAYSREEQLQRLIKLTDSALERKWLAFIDETGLRLPSDAQKLIEQCGTRPDFFYGEHLAAVYVDGPPHDYPERQARDAEKTASLEDQGFTVLRFRHDEEWSSLIEKFPHVFGKTS
jgi:ATP-dependent helicase YprA (DUF1998 family)/very-short-patch-repair endonuclease